MFFVIRLLNCNCYLIFVVEFNFQIYLTDLEAVTCTSTFSLSFHFYSVAPPQHYHWYDAAHSPFPWGSYIAELTTVGNEPSRCQWALRSDFNLLEAYKL